MTNLKGENMFKKMLVFLVVFVPVLLLGQTKLWNDNFTHTVATTEDSKELELIDSPGSLSLEMTVGNIAGAGDTLLFYPRYWTAEGWVTGDTLNWYEVPAFADDDLTTTDTFILPQSADSAKTYIWILDPSATDNIKGYTEKIQIRKVDNGTASHSVLMKALIFERP